MEASYIEKRETFGESGIGRLTALVFLTIGGLILFVAYNVGPFFYYYYELENQFYSHIRVASTYTDKEIREKLLYHIRKLQIPIDKPEDLEIRRDGQNMLIRLKYKEVFYVTFQGKDYDIHTFNFDCKAEGKY